MKSAEREEPLKESERRGIIIGVLAAMLLAALDQTMIMAMTVIFLLILTWGGARFSWIAIQSIEAAHRTSISGGGGGCIAECI